MPALAWKRTNAEHQRPRSAKRTEKTRTTRSSPKSGAANAASETSTNGDAPMYIGLGTLVVILVIVLIIYFVRRA